MRRPRKWELLLQQLTKQLANLPIVKEVRGCGLLNGIHLTEDKAKEVEKALLKDEHIIVHSNKLANTLQIVPRDRTTGECVGKNIDQIWRNKKVKKQ